MRGSSRLWLVAIILSGAFVRLPGLFANSFHGDEALFATWARLIAVGRDPLLSSQLVDKPPLLFYLQALCYPLLGTPAPWVARLPNFIASLLLIPLVGVLSWRLYRHWLPALAAALFIALSPFTVQFSATAFTDPLMTALVTASVMVVVTAAAQRRGPLVGGVLFGLAIATKYQALLFAPLIVALGWMRGWSGSRWRRWLAGNVLPIGVVLLWVAVRDAPVLWAVQQQNYGALRLVWSWELWPRLEEWAQLWGLMFGSPVLGFAIVLALPVFLALLIYDRDWPTAYDQLFLLFIIGYVELHWFLAIPIWDRYLLPLAPLAAFLLGQFGTRVIAFVGPALGAESRVRMLQIAALLVLFVLLVPPALGARQGAFPVGGQPEADGGAALVAGVLYDAPYGTVLYDHWYSWQWRYYLFDRGVFVSWFAHPAALAEDLEVFGREGSRFLALPADETALPVKQAVRAVGYELLPVEAAGDIVLYQLEAGAMLP